MKRLVLIVKKLLTYPAKVGKISGLGEGVFIALPDIDDELLHDIRNRIEFYTLGCKHNIQFGVCPSFIKMFFGQHVLNFDQRRRGKLYHLFPSVYAVDHRFSVAGWDWIRFSSDFVQHVVDRRQARQNLRDALSKYGGFDRAYVFGTGPSLSRAGEREWSDGFRIVCNTIVRDQELFNHIDPHLIVAGDAVYHYSHTLFSKEFRKDLLARMTENQGLYFVYPEIFDVIVQNEFSRFGDRLVPIPTGGPKVLDADLATTFKLPSLGNVLALLLLPLAFTFSRKAILIGFDGRDPRDQKSPFWANSGKHSYPELMWTLKDQFPGFFDHFVPNNDSRQYVKSVHEDLDGLFLDVESRGRSIEMLHPSWTDTLNRRYKGSKSREEYFYGDD